MRKMRHCSPELQVHRTPHGLRGEQTLTQVQERNLTAKQEAFCLFIFQGKSQADAYRLSYDCERQPDDQIYRDASVLMDNPKVVKRLEALTDRAYLPHIMRVAERKARLSEIGKANLTDFVDNDGNITLKPSAALAELSNEEHIIDGQQKLSRRSKRLKLRDPIAAIAELNKMERIGAIDTVANNTVNILNVIVGSENARAAIDMLGKSAQSTQPALITNNNNEVEAKS